MSRGNALPTPLAHVIGGLAATRLLDARGGRRLLFLVLFAFVYANLPDLDFLPGLLRGDPRAYHRGSTHSLGAALVVALATGVFARWRGWGFRLPFLLAFAAYGSHLVLDGITPDTHGRAGIPLFWPLSNTLVGEALPIPWRLREFLHLRLGDDATSFLTTLLSGRAALVIFVEGLLFAPLLAIPAIVRRVFRPFASAASVAASGSRNRIPEPPQGKMPRAS
ncbi:MAG: metal-dependent hydrolase [Longimicrobiales bacterium]